MSIDASHADPRFTATTRRLSAGAYLDSGFRDELLHKIYVAWRSRVAPSYGYDLTRVLSHAWRAWRIDLARDAVAVLLLVGGIVVVPLAVLQAVGLVVMSYALVVISTELFHFVGLLRRLDSLDKARGLRLRLKITGYELAASAALVLMTFLAMQFDGGSWPLRGDPPATLALLAGFAVIAGLAGVTRQIRIRRLGDDGPEDDPRGQRLEEIRRQQAHPFTIYSGFRPFVGSGREMRHWSFAQRLVWADGGLLGARPKEEFSEPPFRTGELVSTLRDSITELASTEHEETRLPGLVVRDRVFIEGTHVSGFEGALEPQPPQPLIDQVMATPTEVARHHIACQVEAWEGELVTTVFVHVSLQGRTLYIEFSTYALTPTPRKFRIVDVVGGTRPLDVAKAGLRDGARMATLLQAPVRLACAPKLLVAALGAQYRHAGVRSRQDIGARVSGRELAGYEVDDDPYPTDRARGAGDTSYFQFLDVARHSKIIERRLLATIERFLIDHGVDTSDFIQRANAILNNGVINTGSGQVNANNSTFGQHGQGGEPPAAAG
jgi:hypothetical protein